MATIPRRPAPRRDNGAIRRMLKTATGHATRVKADPHSIDSEGKYRAKPITLPTTPYNWRDPTPTSGSPSPAAPHRRD
jgi:hypothetical protein